MKKNRIRLVSLIVVSMMLLSLLGSGTSIAGEPNTEQGPVAIVTIEADVISWEAQVENGGMVLTIAGPGDFYLQQEYPSGAQPTFKPEDGAGKRLPDGVYNYELLLVPAKAKVKTEHDDAQRGLAPPEGATEARVLSGSFSILNGGFVTQEAEEGRTEGKIELGEELKDQVILEDLIVDGSLCVGMDCVNGESFGFDTIRLKENNLRIKFQDTSNTASFPSNDWQITANDSNNGGQSKFSIDDIDHWRTPFTIEAGAPSHSLYVDDYGRVGFGTSTPAVELHVKDSDTPTLRLEQDGSGGWSPQTWDVVGREDFFFIRDVTNGSELPFRIQSGADSDSLTIKSDGNVGIGTWSPSYPLELETTNKDATFVAERTSGATAIIAGTSSYASVGSLTNYPVRILANGSWRMEIKTDNSLEMASGAKCTFDGKWTDSSSREAKENIENLTTDEALAALVGLEPVKFNYKAGEEEHVGFIAEDVPELVAIGDRTTLSSMDIVAVLTKVVQEQQETISELSARMAELETQLQESQAQNARP